MQLPAARYRIYSNLRAYVSEIIGTLNPSCDGAPTAALERAVVDFSGVGHCVAVNQARLGIYFCLRALLTQHRHRVVLSPYTIYDVVNMVLAAGGTPVFVDVDTATCNIDPAAISRAIDDQTGAVLITHLHGLACDVERIVGICRSRDVPLIEDAAQALGATVVGRMVGGWGDAGIYSFGLMKNVNSFFGGAVVSRHAKLAERIRRDQESFAPIPTLRLWRQILRGAILDISSWPPVFKTLTYWIFRYGTLHGNALLNRWSRSENDPRRRDVLPVGIRHRMTDGQATVAFRGLEAVEKDCRERLAIAGIYESGLSDITEIGRPPFRADGSHIYTAYAIRVPNRESLIRHLARVGRDCAAQHLRNCADLECFAEFFVDCPNARATADSILLLPTYPRYGCDEAKRTVDAIRSYFGR